MAVAFLYSLIGALVHFIIRDFLQKKGDVGKLKAYWAIVLFAAIGYFALVALTDTILIVEANTGSYYIMAVLFGYICDDLFRRLYEKK